MKRGWKEETGVSDENTSFLRFSLEESVWFQRGQEVGELYSISLEPNVTVYEVEQYIILRGTLDLMGEYNPDPNTELNAENEDYPYHRYVSVIENRENNLFEFHHQFPVDITVPAQRVQAKDELNVGVHTFDYKNPERGCLQISADLWISGIYEDVAEEEETESYQEDVIPVPLTQLDDEREDSPEQAEEIILQQQDDEEAFNSTRIEDDEDSSEMEIYTNQVENDEEEMEEVPLYSQRIEVENSSESQTNENEMEKEVHSLYAQSPFSGGIPGLTPDQEKQFFVEETFPPLKEAIDRNQKITADQPASVNSQAEEVENELIYARQEEDIQTTQPEEVEEIADRPTYQLKDHREPVRFENETNEVEDPMGAVNEYTYANNRNHEEKPVHQSTSYLKDLHTRMESSSESSESLKKKATKKKQEKAKDETKSPLYDLFAEHEEVPQVKLKVCIVQTGESIDSLAERYGISPQNIARVNQLEMTDDLKAGQVIYIPQTAAVYTK